jgi:N-acetylglutamate synthase-like GNAT family acetyltransferase
MRPRPIHPPHHFYRLALQGRVFHGAGTAKLSFTGPVRLIRIHRMIPPGYQVRRACVEDLPELCRLWEEALLPVADLEKRFREFQVVADDAGMFLGAIGLLVLGPQACLHSEVFANPQREDECRDLLWERVMALAHNYGLVRIWTQEDAPFWHHLGFKHAAEEHLREMPVSFGEEQGRWLTFSLRDEATAQKAVEQEFAVFMMQQKEENARMLQQAKTVKYFAAALVLVVSLIVIAMATMLLIRQLRIR